MRLLEKEFVSSFEGTKNHRFVQKRKEKNFALYERFDEEGKSLGFELFKFKVILKGSLLPGGGTEIEDREVYPRANSFGKTAYFIAGENGEERATQKFDCLLKGDVNSSADEDTDSTDLTKVRKEAATGDLQIPNGKFTHADFSDLNQKSKTDTYIQLQQFVKVGKIKLVGTKPPIGGKGRSSNLFEKS